MAAARPHAFSADADPAATNPGNFSIVLGGPLYQLLRRAHMSGDALELARRRVLAIALIAWLPLLALATLEGHAWRGPGVPFLRDVEVHVRFLVAVPLLVAAELLVHLRLRVVVQEFLVRGLVPAESVARFQECLRSAWRLRNSMAVELTLVAVVYGAGVPLLWRNYAGLDALSWISVPDGEGPHLTLAGFWYAGVSVPLFQFLLLRWYFRLLIWMRFLWQVSRIRLDLSAMHADRAAGLGFLTGTVVAFLPLLMAHGALLAGTIASHILRFGGTLKDGVPEIAIMVGYLYILVIGPLLVFAPQVALAKRTAVREYGRLAQRYVRDFEGKWLPGGMPPAQSPLGEADIQSLADISNSFATIGDTTLVPVSRAALLQVAVATLLPLAPLLLTIVPAEELAKRLLQMVL